MPVNEEPTLFSRLGDSEYLREQYSEAHWKEKEAKRLQYFYEKPLIDEPDIALLQNFIKQWLDFYHLDLRQARVMGSGDMPLDRKPDKATIHYIITLLHLSKKPKQQGWQLVGLMSNDHSLVSISFFLSHLIQRVEGRAEIEQGYRDQQNTVKHRRSLVANEAIDDHSTEEEYAE